MGLYNPPSCVGSDWQVDYENTKFVVSEDGNSFEARCTMKRAFAAGGMREITFDEELVWMAGYNLYHSAESRFRYVYGYSYESDLRNAEVIILADAVRSTAMLSVTLAAACVSLLF